MFPLAEIHDLSVLFLLVVLVCLAGAAYMAYLRNALACGLFLLVAVVAAVLGL